MPTLDPSPSPRRDHAAEHRAFVAGKLAGGFVAAKLAEKLFTVSDVAGRWGCTQRYIRDLIAAGKLPAVRLGRRMTRLRPEDVLAYERSKLAK